MRDDWFRHTTWNATIEADFHTHLRRARDKAQPLKIQAALLAEAQPAVSLRLLDRYFETGDSLFLAAAYAIQAKARLALGDVAGAVESYGRALSRETEFPNVKTNSYIEYPLLVAEQGLVERYGDALEVLDSRRADLGFPVQHFVWHAARALILSAIGNVTEARMEARNALVEADRSSSGFRNHQSLGLVGDSFRELRERLRTLSA